MNEEYRYHNTVRKTRLGLNMSFDELIRKANINIIRLQYIEFNGTATIHEAQNLAKALGKTIEDLFPEAMTCLNDYYRRGDSRTHIVKDREKRFEIYKLGLDFGECVYVAKISLKNGVKFKHRLSEYEAYRVRCFFESVEDQNSDKTFVCYDTNTHAVALNRKDVLHIRFEYEYEPFCYNYDTDEHLDQLSIYFRGFTNPELVDCEPDKFESFGECEIDCQLGCLTSSFDTYRPDNLMKNFSVFENRRGQFFFAPFDEVSVLFIPLPHICVPQIEDEE